MGPVALRMATAALSEPVVGVHDDELVHQDDI